MTNKPAAKIAARLVFDTVDESKIIILTEEELSVLSSALWGYQALPDLDESDGGRRRAHRRTVAGNLIWQLEQIAGKEIARGSHWEPKS
jgi:hypothetical protein